MAKTGGRQKGTPNKDHAPVEEMAKRLNIDPLEILFYFAAGDWKALGYESATKTLFSAKGEPFEVPIIEATHRVTAAKEAASYLHSKRKSLEISNADDKGFLVVIRDYSEKK